MTDGTIVIYQIDITTVFPKVLDESLVFSKFYKLASWYLRILFLQLYIFGWNTYGN